MKRILAILALGLITVGILVGSAFGASTSLGGRTITPYGAERTQGAAPYFAVGSVHIIGNSGQQYVQTRLLRNGVQIGSAVTHTVPAGYQNYMVSSLVQCVTTSASIWVTQTKFASQGSWTSAPGKTLYC
jgi:hypothetical protein